MAATHYEPKSKPSRWKRFWSDRPRVVRAAATASVLCGITTTIEFRSAEFGWPVGLAFVALGAALHGRPGVALVRVGFVASALWAVWGLASIVPLWSEQVVASYALSFAAGTALFLGRAWFLEPRLRK